MVRLLFKIPLLNEISRTCLRLTQKRYVWSIGIYEGRNPLLFHYPTRDINPVLTCRDVNDISASFVADPFMVRDNGTWYMFFEVMDTIHNKGKIGLATSADGRNWDYKRIILEESFHLSYPYVFEWGGNYYMIPESREAMSVRLYEAELFPVKWRYLRDLVNGHPYLDPSIARIYGRWWLFTALGNDTLLIHYADDLFGEWHSHKGNPVVLGNNLAARPAGRTICFHGHIIRYAQDCQNEYGSSVRAIEVTRLTPTAYEEKELGQGPILKASGTGWNSHGMHTIDPFQLNENSWIACVDGRQPASLFVLTQRLIKRCIKRSISQ